MSSSASSACLSLILAVSAGALASPAAPSQWQALAIDTLRELVSLDTAEPRGSVAAVNALAARFKAAGFADETVQVLAPAEHPEKANLVVRLAGRGQGKAVLWTSHLDVVSADSRDWTVPPFELTQRQGWLYGRGTSDMKGEATAVAVALIRLHAEGFRPQRDIIAAFTADEEAAGHVNGVRWLLGEHRASIDSEIAFNPDAGGGALRAGQRLYYGIQAAEKTYATYALSATGAGGHSSRPGADNAIYRLSAALLRVSSHRFPVTLSPVTQSFLSGAAASEPAEIRKDMLAIAAQPDDAGAAERLSERPQLNALLRTTCVATLMQAGEAENALPQRAQASLQCRLLPSEDPQAVMTTLREVIADPQVHIELARPVINSPRTELAPDVVELIGRVAGAVWPGVPVLASMDTGGSDAIFTRAAGIPTYGVAAIFKDVDDNRHHGRDERISREAFDSGLEFTYRLMKSFGRRN